MEKIPIWEKQNLTIEEAAIYSNIGINKLRMLIYNPDFDFLLKVCKKNIIKRKKFHNFITHCNNL